MAQKSSSRAGGKQIFHIELEAHERLAVISLKTLRCTNRKNIENHRFSELPGSRECPQNPTHVKVYFCRLLSNKLDQESRTHRLQLQLALAAFRQLLIKLWTFLHPKDASGAMLGSTWEGPGAHLGTILEHF